MSFDYWKECIAGAFDDVGITANAEQIKIVADWVEGAHDNFGLATGLDVADQNLAASRERKIKEAKAETELEKQKIHCRECDGNGRITTQGPYHSSNSECWKCHGEGRHTP